MSRTFSSLKVANYRRYAIGSLVSNIGTWMQRVAQDWLVLQLTHGSGSALGITTGLQFLPMLLFGLWGGVASDRFAKRRLLVLTQSLMGMLSLVLGLLDLSGTVRVWQVYVLAFLLGSVTAVDNPARQSFVVEMVGRSEVTNAVGLNSASFNGARVVGPALAGFLIVLVGTGPLFLLNAASFAAVLVALWRMDPTTLRSAPRARRSPGQLREGLRYVANRPDLVAILTVVGFVGTFGLNFQMTTALMATQVFGRGAGAYGMLGSIMAVGSLAGALLGARRQRPRLRLLLGSAIAFGALEIVSGLMPGYFWFALSLVPVGVSSLTFITAANSTMQLAVDPKMRGRVMALYMMIFMGGTPLGAPLVGWLAEVAGARWSLLSGGIVSLVAAVGAGLVLARVKGLRLRARLRPRPRLVVMEAQIVSTVQQG